MKRVFLSFLHDDIWEVNQFRAVIGNEWTYVLVPNDVISDNKTIQALVAAYGA